MSPPCLIFTLVDWHSGEKKDGYAPSLEEMIKHLTKQGYNVMIRHDLLEDGVLFITKYNRFGTR